MTFADLSNIQGYPGDPLTYVYDHSPWPTSSPDSPEAVAPAKPVQVNPEFARFFHEIPPLMLRDIVPIPPEGYDTVVSKPTGPGLFLTANQCQPCHDGFAGSTGNNMYIPATGDTPSMNLAPFGEWSWSLMGLSGRDPVFYAQLESEQILQPQHAPQIVDLCFSCHGVMGQRQFHLDHKGSKLFTEALVYATPATDPAQAEYGALARNGISCTVCHHIFQVIDAQTNTVIWVSGRTNTLGIIVDATGTPLPSEFFATQGNSQAHQPHHERIHSQRQVQIYEELTQDPQNRFTTSFVARNTVIKDNRLLPKGWSTSGPFAKDTTPRGTACQDPSYPCYAGGTSGVATGTDTISYTIPLQDLGVTTGADLRFVVAVHYQSIPPYYLQQRFSTQRGDRQAKDGKNTRRLHYLTSHVNYDDTPVQGWKLTVVSDCKTTSLSTRPGLTACEQPSATQRQRLH